mmetsp:Transcript_8853/g.39232  ORF Transcript_8853/g.39232 Transcript_8853/m.39232 type:complete len:228 (+) Transcript_8853:908-1591(+)
MQSPRPNAWWWIRYRTNLIHPPQFKALNHRADWNVVKTLRGILTALCRSSINHCAFVHYLLLFLSRSASHSRTSTRSRNATRSVKRFLSFLCASSSSCSLFDSLNSFQSLLLRSRTEAFLDERPATMPSRLFEVAGLGCASSRCTFGSFGWVDGLAVRESVKISKLPTPQETRFFSASCLDASFRNTLRRSLISYRASGPRSGRLKRAEKSSCYQTPRAPSFSSSQE